MFLTDRQKEILEAQQPRAYSQQIPNVRLGISRSSMHSTNTLIFDDFLEALGVMADQENFDTFRRRFKKQDDEIWELTRRIRALVKKAR